MSSGGGGGGTPQQVVTTQNRDPWSGAQPYLQNIMSTAQSNFYNGVGAGVYGGPTQAPLEYQLQNALDRSASLTADPNNLAAVNNARNLANSMQGSQGITPGIGQAISNLNPVADTYSGIAGLNGGLTQNQWNTLSGLDTDALLYGQMYGEAQGNANPYLQGVLDTQGRKIADQVNSNMSGIGSKLIV